MRRLLSMNNLILVTIATAILTFVGTSAYYKGVRDCQTTAQKTQQKLIKDKEKKEKENASTISEIESAGRDASERYSNVIASIVSSHASELQSSEARADRYRDLSETRAAELATLAERYDRIIVDGRAVAERCKAGIEYRDAAINVLVSRIKADIQLIGTK